MSDDQERKTIDASMESGASQWLEGHLEYIKKLIVEEAKKNTKGSELVNPMQIALAAQVYAPGDPFVVSREPSWRERITSSISGVTVMSAVLAVLFGAMAFVLLTYDNPPQDVSAWFDIAKIFSGAVVGSTGAAAVATMRGDQR